MVTISRGAVLLATGAILALAPTAAADGGHGHGRALVRGPLVGSVPTDPVLFGVAPGGRPWVADRKSRIVVRRDGEVRVRAVGFVIPDAPFNGTNPVPALSASVVCGGAIAATTAPVPFDTTGAATIEERLMLPKPCVAPAVLLHPGANTAVYIGVNG